MSKICRVTINDEPFLANRGELLLDWALINGVDLQHD
jgi:3-phenylpropionate/trans-cinnamate dioxygenase ferredoxin reductase subunit